MPAAPAVDPRVAAAAAGDRAAAGALLRELLPRVRNLIRCMAGGDADVDDLTQQVLLELLRSLSGFRGDSALTTWAHRITVRTALRELRRGRTERDRRTEAAPALRLVSGGADTPEGWAVRRQAVDWLDALPAEQRQVVVLHHVAGLSMPEVAEELGVPFETARSRARLGMRKLREMSEGGEAS